MTLLRAITGSVPRAAREREPLRAAPKGEPMLAEFTGVATVFALGVFALIALAFVQRAMGASPASRPVLSHDAPKVVGPDARRRTPLPFMRVLLLCLLLMPAVGFLVAWCLAQRQLGISALPSLALFLAPLVVMGIAFVSKGGLES